jgi:hypothetical protein
VVNQFACTPCPSGLTTPHRGATSAGECEEEKAEEGSLGAVGELLRKRTGEAVLLAIALLALLLLLAFWLYAASVNRGWRRYPLADVVRRELRLDLGASHSPEALAFVSRVDEAATFVERQCGVDFASDLPRLGALLTRALQFVLGDALRPAKSCCGCERSACCPRYSLDAALLSERKEDIAAQFAFLMHRVRGAAASASAALGKAESSVELIAPAREGSVEVALREPDGEVGEPDPLPCEQEAQ